MASSSDDNVTTDKQQSRKQFIPQLLAAFAASISAFSMGTVEAYTSPGMPSMVESPKLGNISSDDQTQIAAIALLAAVLSGPQVGFLVGRIGRKSVLAISALPFVIGWLLIASTTYFPMIYLGRFITGFCAGTASLIVPIYISEISDDLHRGFLCSLFQLSSTVGNFFVYVVGTVLDWQWLAFVCGLVPLVGLLFIAAVPSTPTYLLSKGSLDDALHSLMWLRGTKTPSDVQVELNAIQSNILTCNEERKSYRDLFKLRTIRPLGICLWLLFFQQMTGIEVILIFTVYIFQSARVRMDPNICTIIVGFVQIVATFMSALLVDKAGRRLLLIVSQLGVSVAMMALLIFFHYQPDDESSNNYSLDWVPLTSVCIFMTFFSIGAGPIPFLMLTELNSPAVIGLASSVATTLTWTFAYLVTTFFMTIQSCIGIKWCFGLFCGMSLLGAGFVFVWVPETRAKSMEEIQNYFRKKGGHAKNIGGAGCPSSYHDESHNNNNNTGIIRSDVVT
ncbi:facilitated trehalose transporter Tret1-2 homolog [Folsomia candida]|uniref:facilitated trehalose transporter Tret1-2 homolog n=1 Tax=Folsomia candida TaxID=158441 RepID=UPI000B902BFB|nr:facilitated trehalose transporter Tret1-2 homolog [Folsomia candida]